MSWKTFLSKAKYTDDFAPEEIQDIEEYYSSGAEVVFNTPEEAIRWLNDEH